MRLSDKVMVVTAADQVSGAQALGLRLEAGGLGTEARCMVAAA